MSARAKKTLFSLLTLLLVVFGIELFSFVSVAIRFGQVATPPTLFRALGPVRPPAADGRCSWGDAVRPHPYLSIAYRAKGSCARQGALNEFGWIGDLPPDKDERYFSVLVLGGSVAEDFAGSEPNALAGALNREYASPSGRPWKVYNGAISGGTQPMQALAFLLMVDRVDAVISIEGWNEYASVGTPVGGPSDLWIDLMNATTVGVHQRDALLRQWVGLRFYRYLSHHALFSHSYTMFLVGSSALLLTSVDRPAPTDGTAGAPFEDFRMSREPDDHLIAKRFWLRYRSCLSAIQSIAEWRNIKTAFFVQPLATLHRQLTPKELAEVQVRRRAEPGLSSQLDGYESFADRLLSWRTDGLPMHSLLKIYAQTPEKVYVDPFHTNRVGWEIMAKEIARILGEVWGLPRKEP